MKQSLVEIDNNLSMYEKMMIFGGIEDSCAMMIRNKHTFTRMKPFNASGDGKAISVSGIGRIYRFSVVVG